MGNIWWNEKKAGVLDTRDSKNSKKSSPKNALANKSLTVQPVRSALVVEAEKSL